MILFLITTSKEEVSMIIKTTVDQVRRQDPQVGRCVYLVKDGAARVVYVGQTVNVRSRFQNHLSPSHREKFALALKAALPDSLQWSVELWSEDEFHNDP